MEIVEILNIIGTVFFTIDERVFDRQFKVQLEPLCSSFFLTDLFRFRIKQMSYSSLHYKYVNPLILLSTL